MMTANESLSLKYVFREPTQRDSAGKPPLLLLLHGFGSSEVDLMSFAPYLDKRFFVAGARAPFKLDWGGFAWFDIQYAPQGMTINFQQAAESRARLLKFIDEVTAQHDLDARRIFLAGFSQGAMMTAALVLTAPEKLAGAVTMSGRVVVEHLPNRADDEQLRDFPILVTHGIHDQVLPIANGRGAKTFWEKLPVKLDYHEYEDAHNVSEQSLRDVAAWLTNQLNK